MPVSSGDRAHAGSTARGVELLADIDRLAQSRRDGAISEATFAAVYFLYWQIAKCGDGFAARKHKSDPPPRARAWLDAIATGPPSMLSARLHGYLANHQFRGVSALAAAALGRWVGGEWPLALRETVPSALDVLRAQARGTRMVTAVCAYPRLLEPVLTRPDAFAFFLHDLAHAHKFFHSPALYAGQRALFAALEAAFDRGLLAPYLEDRSFRRKFDYLISDMNTHPQHARQYLRAILIEFHLRRDGKPPRAALSPAARRDVDRVLHAVDAAAPMPARVALARAPRF